MAANSALLGIFLFFFMFPNSISVAVSSYLGFSVGAKLEKVAKNIIYISLISTFFVVAIISGIGQLLVDIIAD
jgi:Na+-driven multidrug efflux pump